MMVGTILNSSLPSFSLVCLLRVRVLFITKPLASYVQFYCTGWRLVWSQMIGKVNGYVIQYFLEARWRSKEI